MLAEFPMSEIFESINGETSLAGYPALFLRFAGCNLRCSWCDTERAYEPSFFLPFEAVLCETQASKQPFVVLTGGEPLLQSQLKDLISAILKHTNKRIVLETNGSLSLEAIHPQVHISMDCKTPSSLQHDHCLFSNFDLLKRTDDVKFVVGSRADYEYSKEIMGKYSLRHRVNIVFQSVYGTLDNQMLANWILEDGLDARFSIQLHKHIGLK